MKKLLILLTVFLTLFSSVFAYNFQAKTIAYFPLNNVSNMITGSQYLTAYNSPTVVAGKYGNAYSMNGSGGGTGTGSNTLYMQAGQSMTNTYFNNNDNFCVSYWVNFGTLTAGAYWLWQIQDSDASPISLGLSTNGTVTTKVTPWSDFIITTSNTGSFTMTNDASFHHEVMCQQYYNSSHNRYLIWEDSTIKINKTLRRDSDSYGANAYLCFLGNCNSHSYGDPKQQIFDEFAIFNATFTQSEVTTLYNSGSGCFFNQLCYLGSSFSSIKTQAGELVTSSYLSMSSIQLNVTTTTPTNKRYFIYKFGNSTLIQSNVMTPTASTSSYYNVTGLTNGQRYNIMFNASNSTTTSITSNYTFTYNPNMALRLKSNITGAYLYNWTLVLPNGTTVFSNNSQYNYFKIVPLGYGTKSFQLVKEGYNTRTINLNLNYTSNINLTYNISYVTLTMRMYDLSNPSRQIKFNVTILNSTSSLVILNQWNLTRNYTQIPHGSLQFIVTSGNYSQAKFYNTITPYTSIRIYGYLVKNSIYYIHQFTVYEQGSSNPLSNVNLDVQYLLSGTYTSIQQGLTDSDGRTYFNLDATKEYKIIFSKNGYVSAILYTIPSILTYSYILSSSTILNYLDGVSTSFSPNTAEVLTNKSYLFKGFIAGTSITQSNFTLKFGNGTLIYSSSSSNPTGTTFTKNYTIPYNTSQTTIMATITYIKNAQIINKTYIWSIKEVQSVLGLDTIFKNQSEKTDYDSKFIKFFLLLFIVLSFIIFGKKLQIDGRYQLTFTIIPAILFCYFVGLIGWILASIGILIAIFIGMREV